MGGPGSWMELGPQLRRQQADRLWADLKARGLQPWSRVDGSIQLTFPDTTRVYDTLRAAYEGAREHETTLRRLS